MTSKSDDNHGTPDRGGGIPASIDPVTLKAPSGRASLQPARGSQWSPPAPSATHSPTPQHPRDDRVIRGGAAADRGLDELLESSRAPRDRVGTIVADRYRIVRQIGTGGVGTVYLAQDAQTGEHVAIKILHRELHFLPEMVARFEREALAASRIDHVNVASAKDFGRLGDGSCYLVLELIEGMSLSEVLTREGALPARRALGIAHQIASGLGAAHRSGIVHRDLKPDNVMLVPSGPDTDVVKVVDFGIAHVPPEEGAMPVRPSGNIFGTPDYMAPEQAAGTIVDHRADLYTLGIVLYEMLCGRTPFRSGDMHAVLEQQMTAAPAPLPVTVEPATARFVMQLLAKDPDLRPPTAEEVCRRIHGLLEPADVTASSRELPLTPSPMSAPASSGIDDVPSAQPDSAPASVRSAPASSAAFRLGTREVPTWVLAVAAALPLALVVAIVLRASKTVTPAPPPVASIEQLSTDQLDALAHRASRGNREAIARLERNPPVTAAQWGAIGRGYSRLKAPERSAHAYSRALELDRSLSSDEALLRDLYRAAADPAAIDLVLEIAVSRLGARGPDLIYDIWANAKSDPASAELAKRTNELMHSPEVRAKSSEALRIAVDLWDGKTCEEYRSLLPRARRHADFRSSPVLRSLTRTEGCGADLQEDCFACLRTGTGLREALESAEKRVPPRL